MDEDETRPLSNRGDAERRTGDRIDDRYVLERLLGRGGAAEVWLAQDETLERQVALKLSSGSQLSDLFQREAQLSARLRHPHIATIYDRGELADGTRYISMEYVAGPSLEQVIAGGASPERAVEITLQILDAVGKAHTEGVLHRDLKPQNVLLDDQDEVKVVDFGIASDSRSAHEGPIAGTAQYMAPEALRGEELGEASDLYSVGVILYRLLSGRAPFARGTDTEVMSRRLGEEEPRPEPLASPERGLPAALDEVLARALDPDPERRYQSAERFADDLERAMRDRRARAAAPPAPDRRKWIVLALALAALVALGLWLLLSGGERTTVPNVVGDPLAEARVKLERADLEADVSREESPRPPGTVVSQDPEPRSEVRAGSSVELIVSAGRGSVEIPDLAGLERDEARTQLEDLGLEVSESTRHSGEVERGRVIETDPPAGEEVDAGAEVEMLVSQGEEPASVPNLVGMEREQAVAELEGRGLSAQVTMVSDEAPRDRVVAQDPEPGERLGPGSTVEIEVSQGPDEVSVPSLIGREEEDAVEALEDLGLEANVRRRGTDDAAEDGLVLDQSPAAGTALRPGEAVAVFVGDHAGS